MILTLPFTAKVLRLFRLAAGRKRHNPVVEEGSLWDPIYIYGRCSHNDETIDSMRAYDAKSRLRGCLCLSVLCSLILFFRIGREVTDTGIVATNPLSYIIAICNAMIGLGGTCYLFTRIFGNEVLP